MVSRLLTSANRPRLSNFIHLINSRYGAFEARPSFSPIIASGKIFVTLSRMAAHPSIATYHYQNIIVFFLDSLRLKTVKQKSQGQEK